MIEILLKAVNNVKVELNPCKYAHNFFYIGLCIPLRLESFFTIKLFLVIEKCPPVVNESIIWADVFKIVSKAPILHFRCLWKSCKNVRKCH